MFQERKPNGKGDIVWSATMTTVEGDRERNGKKKQKKEMIIQDRIKSGTV